MHPLLRSILRSDYGSVDPAIPAMVKLLSDRGADECWHKHSTFGQHLAGVWRIMALWGQRPSACRAGLCHSAYSNSYVNLMIFDEANPSDRKTVTELLGTEAEETIRTWCSINRRAEVVDRLLALSDDNPGDLERQLAHGLEVANLRTGRALRLGPRQVGELLVFEMADAADQQFGWQVRERVAS